MDDQRSVILARISGRLPGYRRTHIYWWLRNQSNSSYPNRNQYLILIYIEREKIRSIDEVGYLVSYISRIVDVFICIPEPIGVEILKYDSSKKPINHISIL